ncbi:MAG: hypothetical protein ACXWQO_12105 [Bdellovibrionota bacterium]
MESQSRKKDTQSAWFDIAVFAVVAAFFLFSAQSLLRSQVRGQSGGEPVAQITDRSIASVQHQDTPAVVGEDHSVQVFKLDCLFGAPPAPLTTKAGMVRIVANICSGNKKPLAKNANFVGKNDSSGEDIVPFVQEGTTVSTNYFSLREGSNKISFQLAVGKGQTLRQELEFVRTPKEE